MTINEQLAGKTILEIDQDAYRTLVYFTDGTVWQILLGDKGYSGSSKSKGGVS